VTTQVADQRAAIEAEAGSRTVLDLLAATAQKYADYPAYSDRDGTGGWQTLTWSQFRAAALRLAAGLIALGLQPGERVGLMLPNRMEHLLADQAAVHAGAVPVTFYATLAPDQVSYIAADCAVRIAVLDGAADVQRWRPVLDRLPSLRTLIVRDLAGCPDDPRLCSWDEFLARSDAAAADPVTAGELSRRIAAVAPEDPVTLLYTSGTTGHPKGVITTHRSVMYEAALARLAGNTAMHPRWVSYLPLAHIAERMFSIYLAFHNAGHTYFCPDPASQLLATVTEVRPTSFFGVPRVWEKIKAGIQALLATQDEAQRAAVTAAMDSGLRYVESRQFGAATSPELAQEFARADEAVLRPIRALLGLDQAATVASAAAPLPTDTARFFAGLGMIILDVYGMTETTGAFTTNTPTAFKLGTVGRALPGMEVRIAGDGEILARGPLNSPGYLNLPEQTTALIDADGWLHTGDIGSIDADGFVSVVDRKKELIITSGGENISPAAIENLLIAHPLIGQALAFGDNRKFVVGLLTLDSEVAPAWARARGIEVASLAELAANEQVLAEVDCAVQDVNRRLARVQQVKRWRLLPLEWTAESGELTPTLKLKRRVVHAKYADVLESLYARA
jgi:long-chain acyl-CoA synthetase